MNKKEFCESNKPEAYYSGFGGIEIYRVEYSTDDYVIFTANSWSGKKTYHKSKIYYGEKKSYFKYKGVRIPLDECIRCA